MPDKMPCEPEWFRHVERLNSTILRKLADALSNSKLNVGVRFFPQQAFWFLCDTLLIANHANRDGMHANAVAITRLCLEAITITELGLVGGAAAEELLLEWSHDQRTPGQLRGWLEANAWSRYGTGMWGEPWAKFYANFCRAIQPFAHYSGLLAQWQSKLHSFEINESSGQAILQFGPRLYDAQKATRITLFHGIIAFVLGRILVANVQADDLNFATEIQALGLALGSSQYLDGHSTDWPQQFWAIMWFGNSATPKQQ